jgi:hypothetical protein
MIRYFECPGNRVNRLDGLDRDRRVQGDPPV